MQPTLTSVRSDAWVTRSRSALLRVLAAFRKGRAPRFADGDLQRRFDALLADAREAGSEAGAWDLSDDFLESIEPRLRRLLRNGSEVCEIDPALLATQVGALSQDLQRLEADGGVRDTPAPSPLASGVGGALGHLACAVVTVVGLQFFGVPMASSGLIGVAVLAGGMALTEAAGRWTRGRATRQRSRRERRLRAEIAALEAEIRRAVRARARVDQWVTESRQLVEAEYRRYRVRAARAMEAPRHASAPGPRAFQVPHEESSGVPYVACR
jgi:hypothetical protein